MAKLASEIIAQKHSSFTNLEQKRILFDNMEMLFHGQLNDLESQEANSQVFDPKLATLTIERAYRVMAQMGVGKIRGISSNDSGDAKIKNLLLEKYVIPNATAQFDLLTKFRMVDLYSNIYGCFFVLVDMDVKANGYVGPDMWLLNIRDVFPQPGAVSIEDSDWIIVRTWKPLSFFEGLRGKPGYKNISTIISKLKSKAGSKQTRDTNNKSKREEEQYPDEVSSVTDDRSNGYFEVVTRFERDRWVDVCVDADLEFRDQKNPHDDGSFPVVCKYSIPLLDDIMGMGDFERGASMQMFINANWNLYGDGVKMSITPPMLINKDNVASMSSFKPIPGAMWLGRGQINNIAQPVNVSPQGISTFQSVYQTANAAMQGLFGSSDTSISADVDDTLGKTPQALKMQSQRENTRDNADRFFMERFINDVMKKMVNLMCKNQTGAVTFRMFPDEIEEIAREYPEVKEYYDEKTGKFSVKHGSKKMLYDYEIVSGSTFALDQKQQQENIAQLIEMYLKYQSPQGNSLDALLKSQGLELKFGELVKRQIANSGIQDWDKILIDLTANEMGENSLTSIEQQFSQALQQQPQQQMMQPPPMPGMPPPQGMPQQMQQPMQAQTPQMPGRPF